MASNLSNLSNLAATARQAANASPDDLQLQQHAINLETAAANEELRNGAQERKISKQKSLDDANKVRADNFAKIESQKAPPQKTSATIYGMMGIAALIVGFATGLGPLLLLFVGAHFITSSSPNNNSRVQNAHLLNNSSPADKEKVTELQPAKAVAPLSNNKDKASSSSKQDAEIEKLKSEIKELKKLNRAAPVVVPAPAAIAPAPVVHAAPGIGIPPPGGIGAPGGHPIVGAPHVAAVAPHAAAAWAPPINPDMLAYAAWQIFPYVALAAMYNMYNAAADMYNGAYNAYGQYIVDKHINYYYGHNDDPEYHFVDRDKVYDKADSVETLLNTSSNSSTAKPEFPYTSPDIATVSLSNKTTSHYATKTAPFPYVTTTPFSYWINDSTTTVNYANVSLDNNLTISNPNINHLEPTAIDANRAFTSFGNNQEHQSAINFNIGDNAYYFTQEELIGFLSGNTEIVNNLINEIHLNTATNEESTMIFHQFNNGLREFIRNNPNQFSWLDLNLLNARTTLGTGVETSDNDISPIKPYNHLFAVNTTSASTGNSSLSLVNFNPVIKISTDPQTQLTGKLNFATNQSTDGIKYNIGDRVYTLSKEAIEGILNGNIDSTTRIQDQLNSYTNNNPVQTDELYLSFISGLQAYIKHNGNAETALDISTINISVSDNNSNNTSQLQLGDATNLVTPRHKSRTALTPTNFDWLNNLGIQSRPYVLLATDFQNSHLNYWGSSARTNTAASLYPSNNITMSSALVVAGQTGTLNESNNISSNQITISNEIATLDSTTRTQVYPKDTFIIRLDNGTQYTINNPEETATSYPEATRAITQFCDTIKSGTLSIDGSSTLNTLPNASLESPVNLNDININLSNPLYQTPTGILTISPQSWRYPTTPNSGYSLTSPNNRYIDWSSTPFYQTAGGGYGYSYRDNFSGLPQSFISGGQDLSSFPFNPDLFNTNNNQVSIYSLDTNGARFADTGSHYTFRLTGSDSYQGFPFVPSQNYLDNPYNNVPTIAGNGTFRQSNALQPNNVSSAHIVATTVMLAYGAKIIAPVVSEIYQNASTLVNNALVDVYNQAPSAVQKTLTTVSESLTNFLSRNNSLNSTIEDGATSRIVDLTKKLNATNADQIFLDFIVENSQSPLGKEQTMLIIKLTDKHSIFLSGEELADFKNGKYEIIPLLKEAFIEAGKSIESPDNSKAPGKTTKLKYAKSTTQKENQTLKDNEYLRIPESKEQQGNSTGNNQSNSSDSVKNTKSDTDYSFWGQVGTLVASTIGIIHFILPSKKSNTVDATDGLYDIHNTSQYDSTSYEYSDPNPLVDRNLVNFDDVYHSSDFPLVGYENGNEYNNFSRSSDFFPTPIEANQYQNFSRTRNSSLSQISEETSHEVSSTSSSVSSIIRQVEDDRYHYPTIYGDKNTSPDFRTKIKNKDKKLTDGEAITERLNRSMARYNI